eukprot:scaffold11797_cov64-Phaeocystis_antarctica.AAC.4
MALLALPQAWLDGERAIATQHRVGVLHALCASRAFGASFVDGGAFTGDAEWDIIQTHCGHVTWVALDDTHAKTAMMLATARAAPEAWEVVYEERQHGQNVPLAAPELGSCGPSLRARLAALGSSTLPGLE